MKSIIYLLFLLCLFCCKPREKKSGDNAEVPVNSNNSTFDFSRFEISEGALGEIKVGMTITDAEKNLTALTKKNVPVYQFGFDGEELVPSYYFRDALILAFIPVYNTDSIRFIFAVHKNFQTINGLSPKSTVKDLLEKYPDVNVNMNMMNGWEYISDDKNKWSFTFIVDDKNSIGEYPKAGEPSKPKTLSRHADWIMIGKSPL